jgi:hypothetical protein
MGAQLPNLDRITLRFMIRTNSTAEKDTDDH